MAQNASPNVVASPSTSSKHRHGDNGFLRNMTLALLSLPVEVLELSLEHIVPEIIKTGSLRAIDIRHRQQSEALRRASLACRQLNRIATPLLYRHLAIATPEQCASLFHTLICTPALRLYGRSFACLALLRAGSRQGYRVVTNQLYRYTQQFVSYHDQSLGLSLDSLAQEVLDCIGIRCNQHDPATPMWEADRMIIPRAVIAIMLVLPCIEDCLLELPEYNLPIDANLSLSALGIPHCYHPSWGGFALSSLHTLRLQGNASISMVGEVADPVIWATSGPALPRIPNLRNLDLLYDDRVYDHGYCGPPIFNGRAHPGCVFSALNQLQQLRLTKSRAAPAQVAWSLSRCKSLTSLTWTFRQALWCIYANTSLDGILEKVRETLRHLRIESLTVGFTIGEKGADPPQIYEYSHCIMVESLSAFPCLESIVIDLMTLLEPSHLYRIQQRTNCRLSDLLPPNIERLELIEKSLDDTYGTPKYNTYHASDPAAQALLAEPLKHSKIHDRCLHLVLWTFARTCNVEQPRLRSFVFQAFRPARKVNRR
ncbi:Uu.00g131950.m01.CDS01 [Anthostomella pinea]|uniref:Uu.00g131950.m01.CDS01 n=1 Tax=Anthostomella pinea TaxID=933095 RepID=A0AAI8VJQ0_9PEZI|nr:Uu.00g131950.m01.CDS01 [Anthostomella pinea]